MHRCRTNRDSDAALTKLFCNALGSVVVADLVEVEDQEAKEVALEMAMVVAAAEGAEEEAEAKP